MWWEECTIGMKLTRSLSSSLRQRIYKWTTGRSYMTNRPVTTTSAATSLANQTTTLAAPVLERPGLGQGLINDGQLPYFETPFLPPPCLPCFQLTTNQRKQNMRPRSVTQDTLHLVSCLQLPFPHVQIFQSENLIRSSKMWRHGSISEASCPSSVLPRASEFLFQMWFLVQTSCFSRTRNLPYLFLNSQYLSPSMASHIFTKKSWNELKSRTEGRRSDEK